MTVRNSIAMSFSMHITIPLLPEETFPDLLKLETLYSKLKSTLL